MTGGFSGQAGGWGKGRETNKKDVRKHVATTSSTPASRQMGRCASMQYCRLQSLQFPARNSFRSSSFCFPPLPASSCPFLSSPSSKSRAKNSCDNGVEVRGKRKPLLRGELARGASSGIMVLLVKHVHLQNEVGAVYFHRRKSVISHDLSAIEVFWAGTDSKQGFAYKLRRRRKRGTREKVE